MSPTASAPNKSLSKEEIRAKRQKLEADLIALKNEIARMGEQWVELQKRTISPDLRYAIYRYPFPEEIEEARILEELTGTREDLARIANARDRALGSDYYKPDAQAIELQKQVNQLQMCVDFAVGASRNPDNDPSVKDYQKKLAETQAKLDERIRLLQSEEPAAKNTETSPEIEALQKEYRLVILKKTQLEEQLVESQQKVAELRPGLSSSHHLDGLEKEIKEKRTAAQSSLFGTQ